MRESSIPDDLQDSSKNIDMDEVFSLFMPPLDCQLTTIESGLRNDLKALKQMRKVFNDLSQEMSNKVAKPCGKIKQPSTTDKAKEEATKLLKSGAISFEASSDKHVFKRKFKDSDSVPADCEETRSTNKNKKPNLYDNFISGEKTKSSFTNVPKLSVNDSNVSEKMQNNELLEPTENLREPNSSRGWEHRYNDPVPSAYSFPSFNDGGSHRRGGSTIYISCNDISESIIKEILEPFGPILHIRLDERKCYAFVTLQSSEEAENALKLDRTMFGNRRLRINYARRQFRPHNEWDNSGSDSLPNRPPTSDRQHKFDHPSSQGSDQCSRSLITYEDVD